MKSAKFAIVTLGCAAAFAAPIDYDVGISGSVPASYSVVASDNDDSDATGLLVGLGAALICAGPAFYIWKMRRYSGSDLRHEYEHKTDSAMSEALASDAFERRVKGASSISL